MSYAGSGTVKTNLCHAVPLSVGINKTMITEIL